MTVADADPEVVRTTSAPNKAIVATAATFIMMTGARIESISTCQWDDNFYHYMASLSPMDNSSVSDRDYQIHVAACFRAGAIPLPEQYFKACLRSAALVCSHITNLARLQVGGPDVSQRARIRD